MIALALARFVRRTPWSTAMALIGVALGVTSIVSVHIVSASVARQLDGLIPAELAGYTHFLHRDDLETGHYFSLRKRWRAGEIADVERIDPLIDESIELSGRPVRVLGIDIFSQRGGLRLQASNRATNDFSWRGVWVDETLVGHVQRPLNGVVSAPPGTIIADIGIAQELLGWPAERISYVGVGHMGSWHALKKYGERLLPGFGAGFPQAHPRWPSVFDWQVLSVGQQHPASQFGKSVLFNISALGLLAMLVAWFLIYQVAVSWLRRLWPVFQRLHVLGVEWVTLRRYFVVVMSLLGLIAGLGGIAMGKWLAEWLYQLVVDEPSVFPLDGWVLAKALGSAVAVCLLGGLWAFRQARSGPTPDYVRLWLAVVLAMFALGGVLVPATDLAGAFVSIALLSVLAVLFISPLLERLRAHAGLLRGPYLVRLSVREAVWYPQDLAVALSGLALAIATAIGVGLMVDSFREDFGRMLERRLSYDLVVRGSEADLQVLRGDLQGRSDARRVQPYAGGQTRVSGIPVELVASRFDEVEVARYGFNRALTGNEILLSEQGARALSLAVGDQLNIAGHAAVVAAVFTSFGDLQPRVLMDVTHPLSAVAGKLESVSVNAENPALLRRTLAKRHMKLAFQLQTELRETAMATFDRTFTITTVLIFIALVVAGIGVYVAVTTLRLNKRTGSDVLASLGVNRLEDVAMDFALGVGIGAIAVALAVPLGVAFGWILCSVINPRAFGWTVELQLGWQAIAGPIIWGMLAAALAGVLRMGRFEAGSVHVRG